ncbi:hypothetical protein D6774_01665 [Candidatus Woesearchaeota archaeon]|nr:MAG: hypothetical protein D6774_01665 [Candidatus Woesearchaeota archaeon]
MIDIVLPSGNESSFIEIARRIGVRKLCFLYERIPSNTYQAPKDIEIITGLLCSEKDIHKNKGKADVLFLKNPSRKAVEQGIVDCIYGLEDTPKDYIHQRGSGMNHIWAKIMAEKGVIYAFDISLLKSKPVVWARMKQNMKLCKKYGVGFRICSFAMLPHQMISADQMKAIEQELLRG